MSKNILIISYHFHPSSAIGARRPTKLACSLAEKNNVTVICKKTELKVADSQLPSTLDVKAIYQHPGILNPVWFFLKSIKAYIKKLMSPNHSEVQATGPKFVQLTKDSYDLENESLAKRVRRYVLSVQSLLDASKSWVALSAVVLLLSKLKRKKIDIVVTSGPTSNAHLLGLLAKKLFGARWVMDLRDPITIWGEIYPWCISQWRRTIEDSLERQYIKQADCIVCTSPSLLLEIENNSPVSKGKLELIYNGFDTTLPDKPIPVSGELRLLYAGALYMNRNPIPMFEATNELILENKIERKKFIFDLYGQCDSWNGVNLIEWISQKGLCDVIQIHGHITQDEVTKKSLCSNVLVNFAQNQPMQIPAKTFDQIAVCKEILLVSEVNSDSAKLIGDNGFGRVSPSDKNSIKSTLEELYLFYVYENNSFSSKLSTRQSFSRVNQNHLYESIINRL